MRRVINNNLFDALLANRLSTTKKILGDKAKEYASDADRLHNFNVAARYDDECPEKALWGMWKKHMVSVQDIINKIETAHQKGEDLMFSNTEMDLINEKITDMVNYTILLEGLFNARKPAKEEENQGSISETKRPESPKVVSR